MKPTENITRIYDPLEIYQELINITNRLKNIEISLDHIHEEIKILQENQEEDHHEMLKITNVRDFFWKFTLPALFVAFSIGLFFSKILLHLKVIGD